MDPILLIREKSVAHVLNQKTMTHTDHEKIELGAAFLVSSSSFNLNNAETLKKLKKS